MTKIKQLFRDSLLLLALMLTTSLSAWADGDVTFEINTPLMTTAGEMFRVEFVIENGKPEDGGFQAPNFEGLEVLAGPTTSQGRQYSNINGKVTNKTTYTITYVVVAQKAGNLTIGSATARIDGKEYKTKATPIEVVEQSQQRTEEAVQERGTAVQNQIAEDDILLKLNLSRTTLYQGEPLRASLTLYTRANIAGFEDVKLPSFNGFWSQELPTDGYQARRETINGKVYDSQVIKEYLLYPQQAGNIVIEPTNITAIAQVVMRSRSFDPFFGGNQQVYNVPRKLTTGSINITVKELPAGAPASFTGAVGNFTLKATPPATELKANSAATYTVRISGTGNLNFVQAPKMELPTSFELYNTRSTESVRATAGGNTGYKQFEYPFIARAEGDYTLPAIEFSYFSPEKQEYITLSHKALPIKVLPDGSGSSKESVQVVSSLMKEDVRQIGSDIRFIKLGSPSLRSLSAPLMLSSTYFAIVAALVVAAIATYYYLRRRIRDSKNSVLVRNRRANKVAIQRFRAAERFMKEDNRHAFFEEMLRALWGYMGDKLNIPVADLTKESIREELQRRGVATEEAQRFTEIITRCDEAQYSPAESVQMNDVYADGVSIISHIESIIKR